MFHYIANEFSEKINKILKKAELRLKWAYSFVIINVYTFTMQHMLLLSEHNMEGFETLW